MLSNHLILCCPLLLLPSFFPIMRVFSDVSALCIMWPKYWSFSFSVNPSNDYSGLISFRFDCFDLLAVQGILKNLLQHLNSKASFFSTQPSLWSNSQRPSMTTGDTIASIIWTFVSKLMSLLFNTLSGFVSFPSKEQASFNFMATVTIHTYLCSCVYMYTPIHSSSLHLKINWLHP